MRFGYLTSSDESGNASPPPPSSSTMTTGPVHADVTVSSHFQSTIITYRIEFEDFYSRTAEYYDTQEFAPNIPCKPRFRFRLYTRKRKGEQRHPPYYVPLQFYLITSEKAFQLKSTASVIGKGDVKLFTHVTSTNHGESDIDYRDYRRTSIIWPPLIKILDEMLKTDLKLTFLCQLEFLTAITEDKSAFSLVKVTQIEQKLVSDNFTELLRSGRYSDVTLVVDGNNFPLHKAILGSRSPVFAKMLEANGAKAQLQITDIDGDIIESLLLYIYTGKVPVTGQFASLCHLLAAASIYQLDSLKSICEQSLTSQLSADNVQEVLRLAELHDALNLKENALHFIKRNTQKTIEALLKDKQDGELLKMFYHLVNKSMLE